MWFVGTIFTVNHTNNTAEAVDAQGRKWILHRGDEIPFLNAPYAGNGTPYVVLTAFGALAPAMQRAPAMQHREPPVATPPKVVVLPEEPENGDKPAALFAINDEQRFTHFSEDGNTYQGELVGKTVSDGNVVYTFKCKTPLRKTGKYTGDSERYNNVTWAVQEGSLVRVEAV